MQFMVMIAISFVISIYAISTWRVVEYIGEMSAYVCRSAEQRSIVEGALLCAAIAFKKDALLKKEVIAQGWIEKDAQLPRALYAHLSARCLVRYEKQGDAILVRVRLLDLNGHLLGQAECRV